MPLTVREIEQEIERLSATDRARLAAFILASLEPADEAASEIEAAWEREVEDRIAAFERGEATSTPADEVFAEARRRRT